MKLSDVRGGMHVRVKSRTDETLNPKFLRRVGRVRSIIVNDCGSPPGDPMLVVAVRGLGTDAFWLEELERVRR